MSYRSSMSRDAFRAAMETMRQRKAIEREQQAQRAEQASIEALDRALKDRRAPVLEYAI